MQNDVSTMEWKEGKKHGKGIFRYFHHGEYEGQWKDGKEHGPGKITYSDGSSLSAAQFAELGFSAGPRVC